MIKCHLSRIMGERKLKVAEVSRATGIGKNILHRMYKETAERVDLDVIDKLCLYLDIRIEDLYEVIDKETSNT